MMMVFYVNTPRCWDGYHHWPHSTTWRSVHLTSITWRPVHLTSITLRPVHLTSNTWRPVHLTSIRGLTGTRRFAPQATPLILVTTSCQSWRTRQCHVKPLSHQTALPQRLYSVLKPCHRAVGTPRNTPKNIKFVIYSVYTTSSQRPYSVRTTFP